jgi:hypothetical protein
MTDAKKIIAPAAPASPLRAVLVPKQAERELAEKIAPEHFFMDGDKLRVRFDELQIRRDPEHPGQMLVDMRHGGQLLVTQMVPDFTGGVLVLHGLEGSTGVSLSND